MRPVVVTLTDASGGAKQSIPIPLDIYAEPEVALQVVVNGTSNYTVQQTLDDVFNPAITPTWFPHPDSNLVANTVNVQGNYAYPARAVRLQINSGTGSATLTVIQAGIMS